MTCLHPDTIPYDARRMARSLYWRGWGVSDIAEELNLNQNTVQSWKTRGKWDEAPAIQKAEDCLLTRFNMLVAKDKKTGGDLKEIDLLGRQVERLARIRRYEEPGGHEGDLNPKVENRNKAAKKAHRKNLIDAEAQVQLRDAFGDGLYGFQADWMNTTALRTRFILKSRQIGATYYFARERLIRALETGNNQIFISASRAQANVFRRYICDFVRMTIGVELKGDIIEIDRGDDEDGNALSKVSLLFLGTNYRTAQSYNGDVIVDEAFWIHGFEEIWKVASAMATHKHLTRTLFSTPSTIAHQAYPMWTGERFNKRRKKDNRVKIDTTHEALKHGAVGGDGIYRQVITVFDAVDYGFDKVDIDELQMDYSVDEFDNLFGCQFVDDSKSCFPLSMLKPCMVDSWEVWRDYDPYAIQPYAGEVWIGYDPNDNEGEGDPAGLVVLAAPRDKTSKFRVLERVKLKGLDFQGQADAIKGYTQKYNVTEIAIDTKGVGNAVWQNVVTFFPRAKKVLYSPVAKGDMVRKAQNVIRNGRLEFDTASVDLAAALMSIHPHTTKGGNYTTYVSRRSADLGHGDIGWALLNALFIEPLDVTESGARKRSSVVISQ